MEVEDLSKPTIKKIWDRMKIMKDIHPLVIATKEAKTEEELLEKLKTIK